MTCKLQQSVQVMQACVSGRHYCLGCRLEFLQKCEEFDNRKPGQTHMSLHCEVNLLQEGM